MIDVMMLGFFALAVALPVLRLRQRQRRLRFIQSLTFPESIRGKLAARYPHLTELQITAVLEGLRDYFHVCNLAGRRTVAMPSQVVDAAWHELILFTLRYQYICRHAFGRFLHHTPTEAMLSPVHATRGVQTAWRLACQREAIDPTAPQRLPRLFALDTQLNIADGFRYRLNCRAAGGPRGDYCASHIGGGDGGSGSSCGGGADSSCGSGCGGGGD